MKREDLKKELLQNIDGVVEIIYNGNTAEIKKNKDGVLILETSRKKIKINNLN